MRPAKVASVRSPSPLVFVRKPSARTIRRATGTQNAAKALGKIKPGCELFGFSKGQFSLINLLRALLAQTGPAHVTVCTWTAAHGSIDDAYGLLAASEILSLRWLIDFSFLSRGADYVQRLREKFGDECIRVTSCHAKFITIRNPKWNLAVRTSMNLTDNPRLENFEISDDRRLRRFLDRIVSEVFEQCPAGDAFTKRPQDHKNDFEAFGADADADGASGDDFGMSLDDPLADGTQFV